MEKLTIGLIEEVVIYDQKGVAHHFLAKIDTGADTCSIDTELALKLGLIPLEKKKRVISSHGRSERIVVEAHIRLSSKEVHVSCTLIEREKLKYKVLIGNNALKQGFLIDPSK